MSEAPKRMGNDGTNFKCPVCRNLVASTEVKTFPFCSDRCRLLDLNNWLDGRYKSSRPVDPTDNIEEFDRLSTKPPPDSR